ncbi:secretory lipase-domain-containing protein [Aspergillus lucknowensis]|uniref:Secretory lipase-domain-containing protein n=1 Tax=Aspergillus lucknowensis TaxID=176173 RepID=A0ABR4M3T7_9EURO
MVSPHFLLALSSALTLVPARPLSAPAPLPPSEDPWYTAPEGYEDAAPGTILRIRPAADSLVTAIGANVSSIYNILYATTDSFDKPSFAVTTLLIPSKPAGKNGTRLLSYQIPYNTVNLDYSPSYALETQFASAFSDIGPALGRGWFVNIPDFEGPKASFSVSVEAAHATLDSLRAVLAAGQGLQPGSHTRIALWGYSGGSIPSEFAAEIAQLYAPEINLSGTAIGGLVANMTHALEVTNAKSYAGLAPLVTLGLATRYPEVQSYLDKNLKPSGRYNATMFNSAAQMATFDAFGAFVNQSIGDYFMTGNEWLYATDLEAAVKRNWQMGKFVFAPTAPMYVYKAIHDELSPVEDTDVVIQKYCDNGANILYERNTVGTHQDEYVRGNARAWAWLVSVLDESYEEVYDSAGCTIRDVTIDGATTPGGSMMAGVPF